MPPAEADPADRVRARLTPHLPVVLAVSGGPDSTALLLAAAETLPRDRLKVVTVDHGLRPGSDDEARAVAALSERLGIAHATRRWDGAKPATGLQQAARAVRHAVFAEEAQAFGATAVALAHTRDDQAETVLMRLGSGSGLGGLAGMAPVARIGGLTLVRPFLDVAKADLVAFATARGVAFADDPSNRDPRFRRPRLRRLAPLLAAEGIDATALARFAERARRADAALDAIAGPLLGRALTDGGLGLSDYAAEPEEIRLRVLQGLIARRGAAARPPSEAELLRLDARLGEGGAATLGGLRFRFRDGILRVAPEGPRRPVGGARPRLRG